MKNLFLTSKASNVLDKFVTMLPCDPSILTVGFVHTGADPYTDKSFVTADRNALIRCKFNVLDIPLTGTTAKELQNKFLNVDIIFVAGGNVFYLLEQTLASCFDTIINNHLIQGKWYIGSSAGSCLLGPSLEPLTLLDDPTKGPHLTSYEGLHIIDYLIIPHAGNKKYDQKIETILQTYPHMVHDMIFLTDDQACIVQDDQTKIL